MEKNSKQRLFEMMGKLDPTFKPKLNEGAFNDAGEPLMTHNQFRDYSEPAEPEYDNNDNRPFQQSQGIGDFNNIDWQMVHEQLVINTELLRANKTSDGNLMAANVSDFTETMLNHDELKQLELFNLIWMDDAFPMIDDEQYLNFETFKSKAAEIWDKEAVSQPISNDSEAPYMRGREPMSEKKINEDNILVNKFIASLPDNFPDLVRQYAKNKNIGLDSAYYQFIGAFEKKFEENNNIEFHLSDDELDELPTFMYGRFGDNAIEF